METIKQLEELGWKKGAKVIDIFDWSVKTIDHIYISTNLQNTPCLKFKEESDPESDEMGQAIWGFFLWPPNEIINQEDREFIKDVQDTITYLRRGNIDWNSIQKS